MQLQSEFKYTVAILLKNISFSALCISVIAVGLAIILPLYVNHYNQNIKIIPLVDGGQYVALRRNVEGERNRGAYSLYDTFQYQYFKNNVNSYRVFDAWKDSISSISDGQFTEAFKSTEISATLIAATEQQPIMGRILAPDDSLPNAEPVVLISYDVWRDYYTGREDIIGVQSRINGTVRTIIGVMPEGFYYPTRHHLWLPLQMSEISTPGDEERSLILVGILKEGVSLQESNDEISTLHEQLNNNWADDYDDNVSSSTVPYTKIFVGDIGGGPPINLIIVLCILFLVAFNISNLFIARGEERLLELSIRSALGAAPTKIAFTLLLESLIICLIGVPFGLLLGSFSIAYVNNMITESNPLQVEVFWYDMSLSSPFIMATILAVLFIWLISGGFAAWRISRSDLNSLMNTGGKGMATSGITKISKILVNFQLVFGCVVMSIALVSTIINSGAKSQNEFDLSNLYSGNFTFNGEAAEDKQFQSNFYGNLEQALLNKTNVSMVSFTTAVPGGGGEFVFFNLEDQDLEVDETFPQQYQVSISNNYFEFFPRNIIQGRSFSIEDRENSLPVAIIDQRTAQQYWPDESAIGKRIKVNPLEESSWLTIVGVNQDIYQEPMALEGDNGTPVIFRPIQQSFPSQFSVVITGNSSNFEFRNVLRESVLEVNRDIAINTIQSLEEIVEIQIKTLNANMKFTLALVLICMYLTAAATYALAARSVSRRRVETGIRMALGANQLSALKVFIKSGFRTVMIGLFFGGTIGILGCYALLSASEIDGPLQFLIPATISICLIMGVIIMLANYIPAKKIISMEPGDALRYE